MHHCSIILKSNSLFVDCCCAIFNSILLKTNVLAWNSVWSWRNRTYGHNVLSWSRCHEWFNRSGWLLSFTTNIITLFYYLEVYRPLSENVWRKKFEPWRRGEWMLPYANVPYSFSTCYSWLLHKIMIWQFLLNLRTRLIWPLSIFLFLKFKYPFKRRRFDAAGELKHKSMEGISHYKKCVIRLEKYFEGRGLKNL